MNKKPLVIILLVSAVVITVFLYIRNIFLMSVAQKATDVAFQQAIEQVKTIDYSGAKVLNIRETLPKTEIFRFATGVNKGNIDILEGMPNVLTGEIKYLGQEAKPTKTTEGNVFTYVINSLDQAGEARTWKLPTTTPIRLEVVAGVGIIKLDLRKLRIETLNVGVGTGETAVLLPQNHSMTGNISAGIGLITIGVPKDVGLKVTMANGLVLDQSESSIVTKVEDGYATENFDKAKIQSTIHIANGAGKIAVISVPDDFSY